MEFAVGTGKLLICMADLEKMENYPEVSQLYAGIIHYMNSSAFQPTTQIDVKDLKQLFAPERL